MIQGKPFRQADEILERLLALPESERAGFLSESSGGDLALRALVERLLAHATADDPRLRPGAGMEMLGVETGDFASHPGSLFEPGDRVGVFRLVRVLGRGGMATVYLAERADGQFEQTVALKVLDRAGGSVARFEQERQILASLDHPNVARLFDGGMTGRGVPYVAMEYIQGEPLLEYCDRRRLSIDQRLRLFVPVAQAVHEAHRKLIVHRDIKSANILVTQQGIPKLLDFGVAKLLAAEALPHAAPATRAVAPLTPEYASPEQVRGELMTVATDVYQLGYLLYLLLTGRSPYTVDSRDMTALLAAITERQPRPPAARISEPAGPHGNGADIFTCRSTVRARLRKRLSGDLGRVVLKALHKDPDRRYASASQLASDIGNVLSDRPIIARPDSVSYRTGKFVRRHALAVSATCIAVIAAIAGSAVFTYRLSHEKQRAEEEAVKAREVSTFLIDLVKLSEPERAQGRDITVREVLDRAAVRIGRELENQPQLQASLQSVVGQMYRELGRYEEAEPLLDRALALQSRVSGAEDPDVADVRVQRARLYLDEGRYEDAVGEIDLAVAALLPSDVELPRRLADAIRLQGAALRMSGKFDEARTKLDEALAIQSRVEPPDHRLMAQTLIELGNLETDVSDFVTSRRYYNDAIEALQLATSQPTLDLADVHLRLSYVAVERNDLDEGQERAQEALDIMRKIYGPTHPDLTYPLEALAAIQANRGQFDLADQSTRELLRISKETLGPEHPEVATVLNNYGTLRFKEGRFEEAAEFYRQAVELRRKVLGPQHPVTAMTMSFRAYALHLAGDPHAEARYREALEVLSAVYEPGHRYIANVKHDLGRLYVETGRYEEAEPLLRTALEARLA
ncbi:MAG TPA: serine/threonine-protein kinase, partial [Woeseiaceae bacterium]|nr:serine/threonine-protein kinase [Woeseiaceae bacterium]